MNLNELIGERIKLLRTAKKLSGEQLAKQLNITKSAISQWEKGKSLPNRANLIKLAEILGVDDEYLVSGTGRFTGIDQIIDETAIYKNREQLLDAAHSIMNRLTDDELISQMIYSFDSLNEDSKKQFLLLQIKRLDLAKNNSYAHQNRLKKISLDNLK
jgi:lexA repressor